MQGAGSRTRSGASPVQSRLLWRGSLLHNCISWGVGGLIECNHISSAWHAGGWAKAACIIMHMVRAACQHTPVCMAFWPVRVLQAHTHLILWQKS